jgi:hypothetical protein
MPLGFLDRSTETETSAPAGLPLTVTLTVAQHVAQMQAILTRIQQEGQVYMQLRHEGLAQKYQEKQAIGQKYQEKQAVAGMNMDEGAEFPTLADTTKQFAPPGPTVSMYDVLLDSMDPSTPRFEVLRRASFLLRVLMENKMNSNMKLKWNSANSKSFAISPWRPLAFTTVWPTQLVNASREIRRLSRTCCKL